MRDSQLSKSAIPDFIYEPQGICCEEEMPDTLLRNEKEKIRSIDIEELAHQELGSKIPLCQKV